jgi:hypothetical protein
MRGVITNREVILNLWVVWREFGLGCLCRCLWAVMSGRETTFLEVAVRPAPIPGAGRARAE